jgi:hypothetical protein
MVDVSHVADVSAAAEPTEAADVRAATKSTDVATTSEAAHVASTAETAASVSTTAAAAGIRCNGEQAGSHQGRCQDRNHSFHVITPFFRDVGIRLQA